MTTTFETGATTAQANDLVLCTMNEGALCADRKHAGFATLQGAEHRLSFRDIVLSVAAQQRAQHGSKYSAAHVSEAVRIVRMQTIAHCLEVIRDDGGPITCCGRQWVDKINGNTYFSARIVVGGHWFSVPFQYGYGSHWEHECSAVLKRIGVNREPQFVNEGPHLRRNMYRGIYV